jgi:hypothetical protein
MKIFATAITCAAILGTPVYAATTHPHRTVTLVNRPASAPPAIQRGDVFLLENRPHAVTPRVPDFQDSFSIDY